MVRNVAFLRLSITRRKIAAARIVVSASETVENQSSAGTIGRNEMDTHADTGVAGKNWRPVEYTGEQVEVQPYSKEYAAIRDIPIAKCATVWTDQETGIDWLLLADQMLWFGDRLDHSLLNPNQMREFGITVRDNPFGDDGLGITTDQVDIPFQLDGTVIYFESRVPTDEELFCLRSIELHSHAWDPGRPHLLAQSNSHRQISSLQLIKELKLESVSPNECRRREILNALHQSEGITRHLAQISPVYDEEQFVHSMLDDTNMTESALDAMLTENKLVVPEFQDNSADIISQVQRAGSERPTVMGVWSRTRHSKVTPEHIAKTWNISLDKAVETMRITTQKGVRQGVHPLHRRYRDIGHHLNRRRIQGHWYCDYLHARTRSIWNNTGGLLFTNGEGFTAFYPTPNKSHEEIGKCYAYFTQDVGVPERLTTDMAKEFVGRHTDFYKQITSHGVNYTLAEQGRKNQNYAAELEIGNLRRRWRQTRAVREIPERLWDFGFVHETRIMRYLPRARHGRSAYEVVIGQTPDISEDADFGFYDVVWWYDDAHKDDTQRVGRWLGPSHRVGNDLTYWILTEHGNVISRSTVQHVTLDDWQHPDKRARIQGFNEAIRHRLDPKNHFIQHDGISDGMYIEDEEPRPNMLQFDDPPDNDYGDMDIPPLPDADDIVDGDEEDGYDKYLNTEVIFETGGELKTGTVVKRARGNDGRPIGRSHSNPMLDSRQYVVEFTDGTTENYFANVIAENIYARIDDEGHQFLLLKEIVDHKKGTDAIPVENGYIMTRSGKKIPKKTTRGWKLLVEWKSGGQDWIDLKELKESYPVEVAEYAVNNRIAGEPAFNWWVRQVLRKRDRIISKVKSRYWRTTHKYGIRIPKTVEEALQHDKVNGNNYWEKAIEKEMSKAKVSWRVHREHTPDEVRHGKCKELIGYQEIKCHLVFDVKMDLTRKARFCANGNEADAPSSITYSSVVSRDSIRLVFLIAGLNDLDILAADVTNAYLNANVREKIWFVGGVETGEGCGKVCVLVKALYGLKSSGAAWRQHFAETLRRMAFVPTEADPDVWLRPSTTEGGFEYYEIVCVYVDDILCISKEPHTLIEVIKESYELKEGSIKPPDVYLGATVEKTETKEGLTCWAMSAEAYIKNAIKVVESLLEEDGSEKRLRTTARTPFPSNYRPELDVTPELDPEMATRFMQLVGILRWAVELGQLDVFHELSQLSQHQALPREGHLEAIYHIFAYLKHSGGRKRRIVFDPRPPDLDLTHLVKADWQDFYPDACEEISPRAPRPRGRPVRINCFVDANHAGNLLTRRSHTGIIIYVQNAPIIWYSKRQNTVESSSFGSEFVALRIAKELIVALRFKLRSFGVPIEGPHEDPGGPALVHCDNNGVVKNTSRPESTLSKKHVSINYHSVREAVAAGIILVSKEDSATNIADGFTKVLPAPRRKSIFDDMLY